VNSDFDDISFSKGYKISHGSQTSSTMVSNKTFVITTPSGTNSTFVPARAIGVDPLRQYLIPWHGGRFQSTELAFASSVSEWFDVFGQEDRKPGEWGHWTGRGMTWNSMCAACHNTRLRKHYNITTDTYQTSMAEMGVGCEACHGPMAGHASSARNKDSSKIAPTASASQGPGLNSTSIIGRGGSMSSENLKLMSICGSCHSRRSELTGEFRPGENFFDHFGLTIPDESETFYADGQVHEEDYEFTSFLGSRMGAAGVRCIDCHEPHSGKTRIPGNGLCMVCHAAPIAPAPKIHPANHTHHTPASTGSQCVTCHMPQTAYMQLHNRHDHGFTIPDPLLTKQFQIPNACNRCHTDKSTEWSMDAVDKWYGAKMQRASRGRAQTIARARMSDKSAVPGLLKLAATETNAFWRAVSANLLKQWATEKEVTEALAKGLENTNLLVRSASIRALELPAQTSEALQSKLKQYLNDSIRAARVDAAWLLRGSLDTNSMAGRDLLAYLQHNADEPAGQLQLGLFYMDRHEPSHAMECFEKALSWDPNSAPLHDALAVGLSLQGNTSRAVTELEFACRLAPKDAEFQFKLALALNEDGKPERARAALEQTVKLDPNFARAWYNLGLSYNAASQSDSALESLSRAESLDPSSPQIPFSRATILARLGRTEEARMAARRALEIQPSYPEAEGLLQSLEK
jgi:tetratricopeptide (TPR) repeat protein